MRPTIPVLAFLIALPIAASLLLACGDDNGYDDATPTEPAPTATAPSEEPTLPPGTDATPGENELGAAPIFWRTLDGFASLRANEPYKVVFRVTNGYAEETLRIVAQKGNGAPPTTMEIEANRVEAGAGEAPGSYYATNLVLGPGPWQLLIFAGEDEVGLHVEAAPAS